MSGKIRIDCKCDNNRRLNEFNQIGADVRAMQNPKVVKILLKLPTMRYKNNPRENMQPPDIETGFSYNFGGRMTHQCVDERDVARLLERVRARQKLFVLENPDLVEQPEFDAPAVDHQSTHPFDPFAANNQAAQLLSREDAINELQEIDGIGSKTAVALYEGGYSVASLAQLDADDPAVIMEIADKTDKQAALIARAINGSKELVAQPTDQEDANGGAENASQDAQ